MAKQKKVATPVLNATKAPKPIPDVFKFANMIEVRGRLYVATDQGVYTMEQNQLKKIKFGAKE